MKFLTNIDFSKNEIQNAVIQPLASAPANPKLGQIYYNSSDNFLYRYTGSVWGPVGVVYSQGSSTGAVITGLSNTGEVTTTNVVGLTLTGYTPVTDGYVTTGMTFQQAISALDTAVKNAVAGGGEVNQNAWSYISTNVQSANESTEVTGNTSAVTLEADAKMDTFSVESGDVWIHVKGDASNDKITLGHKFSNANGTYGDANTATTNANIPNITVDKAGHISSASEVAVVGSKYIYGLTSDAQSQMNALDQRIDDISAIGRFLSYWDCSTGLAVTNPTTSPYTYNTGDYFVVSTVASGGGTNYKPNGSTYTTGVASTTVESLTVAPQDVYRYDGTNWSLSKNTQPDLSGYVATFSQSFTDAQKQQARTNIGAGTSSFSGSFNDLTNRPSVNNTTTSSSTSIYAPTSAGTSGQVLTSNGTGNAPTWQPAPESVHKYTATNPSLSASGGAFTWNITSATHGISNNAIYIALYQVSTGEQIIADVSINSSTYAITITIVDSASSGTLASGTYRIVAIG